MKATTIKFNRKDQTDFFKVLRKRVNTYFKEKGISKYADGRMKFKTAFMIALYFVPFFLMIFGVANTNTSVISMWILMGLGMGGIGLSVMHDANHGSYSKKKIVNTLLGKLILFIGGYSNNWKIQHNVLHHSYTNIDGFDDDINAPVLRMAPSQDRKSLHRFQAYYATFAYAIMTMYWSTVKDFTDLSKYYKRDLLKTQGLTLTSALTHIITNKVVYFAFTLVLPLMVVPVSWQYTIIGFLIMHVICGLALAFIFQPAHVIEETEFLMPDDEGMMDNDFAIHQMMTTSNFANKSRLFSWYVGGLNYQVEHHLFPNICHIHYRDISKIVEETAQEFDIPYLQHKTWFGALRSHFRTLHQLGTGKYDKMITGA